MLVGVRQQADQHLAEQRRVALPRAPGSTSMPTSTPSGATSACAASSAASSTSTTSGLALADRLHPRQRQQRVGQAADPLGVLGEAVRKCSRASGSSLAPARSTSIAPEMPGDRIAQLVRGVGDELALGELAAQLLGAVADDDQHRVLGRELARLSA